MTSSSVRANRPLACRIYPTNPRVHHLCGRVRVRVMFRSLPQDAGHRPQDAPGRLRAGTFVPLLLLTTPLVPHSNPAPPPRTACGNTSTRSRKQKTPSSVRPHLTSPFHPVPSVHLFSLLALAHTGKTAVDKAAANRFIKHAIAQAKESAQAPGAGASSGSSGNREDRRAEVHF